MKAIMAITIALMMAAAPMAAAQDLGVQTAVESEVEDQPYIEKLHITGKGAFMPSEVSDTKLIKAVIAGVKTPNGREVDMGVIKVDGLGDHANYRVTNVVFSESSVTGDIVDRETGEAVGSISIERASFGVEEVQDAWIGKMTLNGLEGNVFILSSKRSYTATERHRVIAEEKSGGGEGSDNELYIRHLVETSDEDARSRVALRVECEKEDNEVICKREIEGQPAEVRAHAVAVLPLHVSTRVVDAETIDESSADATTELQMKRLEAIKIDSSRLRIRQTEARLLESESDSNSGSGSSGES